MERQHIILLRIFPL